jgi:catalase
MVIGGAEADMAGLFIKAIAQHRFWEREKPHKVPA